MFNSINNALVMLLGQNINPILQALISVSSPRTDIVSITTHDGVSWSIYYIMFYYSML